MKFQDEPSLRAGQKSDLIIKGAVSQHLANQTGYCHQIG